VAQRTWQPVCAARNATPGPTCPRGPLGPSTASPTAAPCSRCLTPDLSALTPPLELLPRMAWYPMASTTRLARSPSLDWEITTQTPSPRCKPANDKRSPCRNAYTTLRLSQSIPSRSISTRQESERSLIAHARRRPKNRMPILYCDLPETITAEAPFTPQSPQNHRHRNMLGGYPRSSPGKPYRKQVM